MAEEGAVRDLERLVQQLQALFGRHSSDTLQAQSEPFCSEFFTLVEEHASRWQTPLPQLRILEIALCYFAQASTFLPSSCDHVIHTLSSLALSIFELLLFFDQKDFSHEPLKQFTVTFQECHSSFAKHQNVHLLQLERLLQGGGVWAFPALQAILSDASLPQNEVDGCITSEPPVFFELRVRYLLSCKRIKEAAALSRCCARHPMAGRHSFFLQVYLASLYKTSQHELLHTEVSGFNGKDAVNIICALDCEESDELLLSLTRVFLSEQLRRGDVHQLGDLFLVWMKLHNRLNTPKTPFLQDSRKLMSSATNVSSIFPFIRAILHEMGEDGIQFCVELCANALQSFPASDVTTKSVIYKTIAALVPNDLEVCRACALLVFFLERSVDSYKTVYLLYMLPDQQYHVDSSSIGNQVRFETLQILKKDLYFDPEFWNLIALRTNCLKLMRERGVGTALNEIMGDKWIAKYCTKDSALRQICKERKCMSNTATQKRPIKGDAVNPPKKFKVGRGRPRLNADYSGKKTGNQRSQMLQEASSNPLRRSFWQLDRIQDREHGRITRLSEKTVKRKIQKPRWLLQDSGLLDEKRLRKHGLRCRKHLRSSVLNRQESDEQENDIKQKASLNSDMKPKEITNTKLNRESVDSQRDRTPQVILELSLPDNELSGTFSDESRHRQRGFPQMLLYKPTEKFPDSPVKTAHGYYGKMVILRARDPSMFVQQLHCYIRRPKGKDICSNVHGSVSTITRSSVQGNPAQDAPKTNAPCEKSMIHLRGRVSPQTEVVTEISHIKSTEFVSKELTEESVDSEAPDVLKSVATGGETFEEPAVEMKVTIASPILDKVSKDEVLPSSTEKVNPKQAGDKIPPVCEQISAACDTEPSPTQQVSPKKREESSKSLSDQQVSPQKREEESKQSKQVSPKKREVAKSLSDQQVSPKKREESSKSLSDQQVSPQKREESKKVSPQKREESKSLSDQQGSPKKREEESKQSKQVSPKKREESKSLSDQQGSPKKREEESKQSKQVSPKKREESKSLSDQQGPPKKREEESKQSKQVSPKKREESKSLSDQQVSPKKREEFKQSKHVSPKKREEESKSLSIQAEQEKEVSNFVSDAVDLNIPPKDLIPDASLTSKAQTALGNIFSTSVTVVVRKMTPEQLNQERNNVEQRFLGNGAFKDLNEIGKPESPPRNELPTSTCAESQTKAPQSDVKENPRSKRDVGLDPLEDDDDDLGEDEPESEESKLEFCCTFCNKDFKGCRVVKHAMCHYRRDECMFCGTIFKDDLLAMMHLSKHIETLKKIIKKETACNVAKEKAPPQIKEMPPSEPVVSSERRKRGRPRKIETSVISVKSIKVRSYKEDDGSSSREQSRRGRIPIYKLNGHIGKKKEMKKLRSGLKVIATLAKRHSRNERKSRALVNHRLVKPQSNAKDSFATSHQVDKPLAGPVEDMKKTVKAPQRLKMSAKQKRKLKEKPDAPKEKVSCPVNGCQWFTDISKNRKALLYHALDEHSGEVKPLELAFRISKSSCSICMRVLWSFEHFQHHIEQHKLTPRYSCLHQGCSARFKTGNEMRRHTRKHSPLQAVCCVPGCPKLFICLWALNLHERDHYSKKSSKTIKNLHKLRQKERKEREDSKRDSKQNQTVKDSKDRTDEAKTAKADSDQTTHQSTKLKHLKVPSSLSVSKRKNHPTSRLRTLRSFINDALPNIPNQVRPLSLYLRGRRARYKLKKKQPKVNTKEPKKRGRPRKNINPLNVKHTTTTVREKMNHVQLPLKDSEVCRKKVATCEQIKQGGKTAENQPRDQNTPKPVGKKDKEKTKSSTPSSTNRPLINKSDAKTQKAKAANLTTRSSSSVSLNSVKDKVKKEIKKHQTSKKSGVDQGSMEVEHKTIGNEIKKRLRQKGQETTLNRLHENEQQKEKKRQRDATRRTRGQEEKESQTPACESSVAAASVDLNAKTEPKTNCLKAAKQDASKKSSHTKTKKLKEEPKRETEIMKRPKRKSTETGSQAQPLAEGKTETTESCAVNKDINEDRKVKKRCIDDNEKPSAITKPSETESQVQQISEGKAKTTESCAVKNKKIIDLKQLRKVLKRCIENNKPPGVKKPLPITEDQANSTESCAVKNEQKKDLEKDRKVKKQCIDNDKASAITKPSETESQIQQITKGKAKTTESCAVKNKQKEDRKSKNHSIDNKDNKNNPSAIKKPSEPESQVQPTTKGKVKTKEECAVKTKQKKDLKKERKVIKRRIENDNPPKIKKPSETESNVQQISEAKAKTTESSAVKKKDRKVVKRRVDKPSAVKKPAAVKKPSPNTGGKEKITESCAVKKKPKKDLKEDRKNQNQLIDNNKDIPSAIKKPSDTESQVQPIAEDKMEAADSSVDSTPTVTVTNDSVVMNGVAPCVTQASLSMDVLEKYKKKPFMRLPPTAYLDERFTTMPKRRKELSWISAPAKSSLPSQQRSSSAVQRQRCTTCFTAFTSTEELQTHLQTQSCSKLFGFDSDED